MKHWLQQSWTLVDLYAKAPIWNFLKASCNAITQKNPLQSLWKNQRHYVLHRVKASSSVQRNCWWKGKEKMYVVCVYATDHNSRFRCAILSCLRLAMKSWDFPACFTKKHRSVFSCRNLPQRLTWFINESIAQTNRLIQWHHVIVVEQ